MSKWSTGTTWSTLKIPWSQIHVPWSQIPFQYAEPGTNAMNELERILNDLGLPGPIVWEMDGIGNEALMIRYLRSEPIILMAGANVRRYFFELSYYMRLKAASYKDNYLDSINKRTAKIERGLFDHHYRSRAGTYYWHDGEVGTSLPDDELRDDEISENLHAARIPWECTVTEAI